MKFKIILGLLAVSLMISCKSQKENVDKNGNKTVKIEEKKEAKFNIDESRGFYQITFIKDAIELNEMKPTIVFDGEGQVSGHNGCNSYFGTLIPEGDTVIANIGSTRMACEGENGDIETMLMLKLREITNIQVMEPNEVHLSINEEVVIKATKVYLEGEFQVTSLNGSQGMNGAFGFSINENQLRGSTVCNSFFGPIVQNGFSVRFSEIAASERDCPESDMKSETAFIDALIRVNKYELEGNNYSFYQGDKIVMTAIKN